MMTTTSTTSTTEFLGSQERLLIEKFREIGREARRRNTKLPGTRKCRVVQPGALPRRPRSRTLSASADAERVVSLWTAVIRSHFVYPRISLARFLFQERQYVESLSSRSDVARRLDSAAVVSPTASSAIPLRDRKRTRCRHSMPPDRPHTKSQGNPLT